MRQFKHQALTIFYPTTCKKPSNNELEDVFRLYIVAKAGHFKPTYLNQLLNGHLGKKIELDYDLEAQKFIIKSIFN